MSEVQNNNSEIKLEKELNLLDEFAPPTYDKWKEKVVADLKGAPFEKKLLTKTYEGITLQPIYTQNDIKDLPHLENTPGFNEYVRSSNAAGYLKKSWDISQELPYGLAEDFNAALKIDLERGQTAINIKLDTATLKGLDADYAEETEVGNGVSISGLKSLERALDGIDITKYPIHVDAGFSSFPFHSVLCAYAKKNDIDVSKFNGFVTSDPVAYLAVNGSLPITLDYAYNKMKVTTEHVAKYNSKLKTVGVNGLSYHNAGASATQELAIVMATASEYLTQLTERGLDINIAAKAIQFTFGIGTFYFMEIAKLRAARLMWAKIVEAFGGNTEAQKMTIHARCSNYTQTILDPYVNMLRTTTEAFSAVIGGADSITTNPFDETTGTPDEFSRRISRNTQIILKEESHLDSLIDPAGGSFYIERLTHEVSQEAWKLFQTIEEKGGVVKALAEGFIQEEIEKVVASRNKDYGKRKSVIVGSNMYANVKEEKLADKTPDYKSIFAKRADYLQKFRVSGSQEIDKKILEKLNFLINDMSESAITTAAEAILEGATLGEVTKATRATAEESVKVTPVKLHRASELFENLRNAAEKFEKETGSKPKIFLANMGPLRTHKARADFSRGFFEVGGFEIVYPDGFETPEDAAKAAVESGACATVICSIDDNYPEIVPGLAKNIKDKNPDMTLVLAGYPKDQIEAHKASGVDEFIFMGADVYKIVSSLMEKAGIIK